MQTDNWEDSEKEGGEATYLAPELLNSDHIEGLGPGPATATATSIVGQTADIFSLGTILYEIAADVNLPKRGMDWHKLRSGVVRLSVSLCPSLCVVCPCCSFVCLFVVFVCDVEFSILFCRCVLFSVCLLLISCC